MTISFLGFIRCDGVSVSAGLACLPGQLQQTAQKKKGGSVAAFRRRSTRWREPLRPTSTGDPSTLGLLWHTGTTLTTIWQLLRGSTTAIPVGCVSGKDQDGRVRIQDRSRV